MTVEQDDSKSVNRAKSRDPLVGATLDGRFEIEEVLGSGGMSVVYKATQLRVNRHVAIKTLRVQLDTKDVYRERFQREINLLSTLNHPNIVTVYDCLIGPDDQPYVVMDYLRGSSLEKLIKDGGALAPERCVRIAVQVLSALDHAHRRGVIHRDVKPGNIVLMDNEMDFVKVVDFGLAKLSQDNRRLTQSGELWGSPPYMSPEQATGKPEDERSDIYSFGAVLYEMLSGKDPFHYAVSVFELIQTHVKTTPPPMVEANPAVVIPAKLEQVVFKALAKDPADRFQTASEMLNAVVEASAGMRSGESGELLLLADSAKVKSGTTFARLEAVEQEKPNDVFNRALDPMRGMTVAEPAGTAAQMPPAPGAGLDGATADALAKLAGERAKIDKPKIDNIRNFQPAVAQPKKDFRLIGLGAVAVALLALVLINALPHPHVIPAERPVPLAAPQSTAPAAVTKPGPASTAETPPPAQSETTVNTPAAQKGEPHEPVLKHAAVPALNQPSAAGSNHATASGARHAAGSPLKHAGQASARHSADASRHGAAADSRPAHSASPRSSKSNPWDALQGLRHSQQD